MSLPDASGQAREALYLIASGAASRVMLGLSGLAGRRLPRALAAALDVAAFAAAAGLCAVALFLSGGEARPAAYLFFFSGLFLACAPTFVYKRRQEIRRRGANTRKDAEEG